MMEQLFKLDSVSGIQFGLVSGCVFPSDVYLVGKDYCCHFITIQCQCDVDLKLEHVVLEMKAGETYFLKPPPPQSCKIDDRCIVQRFMLHRSTDWRGFARADQMSFSREMFIDVLKHHIGSKKLLLTCWPFENVSLRHFLDECRIPFRLVSKMFNHKYVCDVRRNEQRRTYLIYLFPYENVNDHANGHLFSDGRKEQPREKSFIIFNPYEKATGDGEEVVLPSKIHRTHFLKFRKHYLKNFFNEFC